MYNVESLLLVSFGAAGIFLKKLAIKHTNARQGVSAGQPMETGEVVEHYHGTHVYSDLSQQTRLKITSE